MKICILSDLHLEFEDFEIDTADADVLVLAGDIHVGNKGVLWALERVKDIPVIYVLGNHEYYKNAYPKLISKLKDLAANTNVHVLENDMVTLDGVNFYGCTLWTDFELFGDPRHAGFECQQIMSDFKRIRLEPRYSKIRSIDLAVIHKHSINKLKKIYAHGASNVIVTHHAPSPLSIPEHYKDNIVSAAYASNLEALINEFKPNLWIHGHLHNSSNYTVGDTTVVCNPKGYPDELNPDFNPSYIFDLD